MLETFFGEMNIYIDGEKTDYDIIKLPLEEKNFNVDARYQIVIRNIRNDKNTIIDCVINETGLQQLDRCIESGEDLALISFYSNNTKLSMGMREENTAICYEYLDNGIRMNISKENILQEILVNIAWITMKNQDIEDIYTWYAADPTIEY